MESLTTDQKLSLLVKYRQAYYFGNPLVSDVEYDLFEDEVRRELEDPDNHPVFSQTGAPIPNNVLREKVTHSIPMGSQSKAKTVDDMEKWAGHAPTEYGYVASLKLDGASIAAYYENGRLTCVATRGDGADAQGEDITQNAIKFRGIPSYVEIEGKPFTGGVRLEAILHVGDWKDIDPTMVSNPRNVGNGICRRTDGENCDKIFAYAFDVHSDEIDFATEFNKVGLLKQAGFFVAPFMMCNSLQQVEEFYSDAVSRRPNMDYWIDGVVAKINDLELQEKLGYHSGLKPRGQIAWKFEAEVAKTVLREVVITGGRTGVLIPNARFDTVVIGGSNVSAASLCNWEEIERLGLAVGDTILVGKMNDIIPKVLRVIEEGETRVPIPEPDACPFCEGDVQRATSTNDDAEGSLTMCVNEFCPKKAIGRIANWIDTHRILGIGDSILEALVDDLCVMDIEDLYRLDGSIEMLIINEKGGRLGKSRAKKILTNIEKSKTMTLAKFLKGLGIRFLGERRAILMMEASEGRLTTLDDWMGVSPSEADFLAQIGVPGIGEHIFQGIERSMGTIEALVNHHGVNVEPFEVKTEPTGGTLCISGKLPSGKKKNDYASDLAGIGIELVSSLKRDTTYLVVNDPNSTKAKKAQKYGTKILNEDDLKKMLEAK